MKKITLCSVLAVVGMALIGCGESAPTDTKDQLSEMRSSVPKDVKPLDEGQATADTRSMGAGMKKGG